MERVEKGNGGDRRAAFSSLTRLGPSVTPSLIPTSTLHLRFRAGGEVMGDQGNQEPIRPEVTRRDTNERPIVTAGWSDKTRCIPVLSSCRSLTTHVPSVLSPLGSFRFRTFTSSRLSAPSLRGEW